MFFKISRFLYLPYTFEFQVYEGAHLIFKDGFLPDCYLFYLII